MTTFDKPIEMHFTARDGLRLFARHYPAPGARRRSVLCLPGLTRNGRDFDTLARVLANPHGHRREVYCLDYRGRGRSEFDPDASNYSVGTELNDVLDFMAMTGLHDAAVIGTSRGGLIAMAMASARPAAIGALVLNDIGPVLEREGLARIVASVGRIPLPNSWAEATRIVRGMNERAFTELNDAGWEAFTRQLFNDESGRPAPGYDPRLSRAIALSNGPLPALWPQFTALGRVPVMVLRGENSDLLSVATVEEMCRRHQRLEAHTVPGEGHSPLIKDRETIDVVYQFLARTDAPIHLVAEPVRASLGGGGV